MRQSPSRARSAQAASQMIDVVFGRVESGEDGGNAWRSKGGSRVKIGKDGSLASEFVNVGSGRKPVPVEGDILGAQSVEGDQENVGSGRATALRVWVLQPQARFPHRRLYGDECVAATPVPAHGAPGRLFVKETIQAGDQLLAPAGNA